MYVLWVFVDEGLFQPPNVKDCKLLLIKVFWTKKLQLKSVFAQNIMLGFDCNTLCQDHVNKLFESQEILTTEIDKVDSAIGQFVHIWNEKV